MSKLQRVIAALLAATVLGGCTVVAARDRGAPTCDRNGDEDQRIACVR